MTCEGPSALYQQLQCEASKLTNTSQSVLYFGPLDFIQSGQSRHIHNPLDLPKTMKLAQPQQVLLENTKIQRSAGYITLFYSECTVVH